MKQTPFKNIRTAIMLITVALTAMVLGCSNYSTQSYSTQSVTVSVDLQRPTLLLQQSIGRIDLAVFRGSTITEEQEPEVYLILTETGGVVTAVIDSLPASDPLLFVLTAWDIERGVPLYQDRRIIRLLPDRMNNVTMTLRPAAPLLRVRPRFISRTTAETFPLDVRVDSVQSLYGLAFRVNYETTMLHIDSVQSIAGSGTIFVAEQEDSPTSGFGAWAIGISSTQPGVPLVNSAGSAGLVRLYCRAAWPPPWEVTDTASIQLQVTDGTYTDSSQISMMDIFTDDCLIEFHTDGWFDDWYQGDGIGDSLR
jgi:hypothetical protein